MKKAAEKKPEAPRPFERLCALISALSPVIVALIITRKR